MLLNGSDSIGRAAQVNAIQCIRNETMTAHTYSSLYMCSSQKRTFTNASNRNSLMKNRIALTPSLNLRNNNKIAISNTGENICVDSTLWNIHSCVFVWIVVGEQFTDIGTKIKKTLQLYIEGRER